jgi:thiol-disulfide isomerase/thioredoxin
MSATGLRLVFATVFTLAIGAALHAGRTPGRAEIPSLAGATGWLNSPALTPTDLRGKVVVVDFWTFTCINWLRTLPYLRAWDAKYRDQGLVTIGVHTPEFISIETDVEAVRRAARRLGVGYPIAIDSDYSVWRAFDNHYWPALYVFDAQGRLRHWQFGEGGYAKSEQMIQQLLAETEARGVDKRPAPIEVRAIEAPADLVNLRSPETYVGYDRAERFASPGGTASGQRHVYEFPAALALNEWALAGDWTINGQPAVANDRNVRIAYRFHARDLNLVMAPAKGATAVRFRILIDGQPPSAAHGVDVDEQGLGTITEPRVYQLIRQPPRIVDRRFEIEFLDPGVEALAFTFG